MWGTFLSEPLPIVATVGRYPAVKLIGRIPICGRSKPFVLSGCRFRTHALLALLSEGCGAAAGRLDTRYSPVRRSPAAYCYAPLPLDLHVLSL